MFGMFNFFKKGRRVNLPDDLASLAFSETQMPMIVMDGEGQIILMNTACEELSGYKKSEITGRNISIFKSGEYDHTFYQSIWETLNSEKKYNGEFWSKMKDDSLRLIDSQISLIDVHRLSGSYFVCIFNDVTKNHQLKERYLYLANHDSLTGLANRSLLNDRFAHAMDNAVRTGENLGVILFDMNEFKQINDTFGHAAGDAVLKHVANEIKNHVRSSDTVARYGGDEFLIIAEHLKSKDELIQLAETIHNSIRKDIIHDMQFITLSLSMGYAYFPEDGVSMKQLVMISDQNMYVEKERYYGFHTNEL